MSTVEYPWRWLTESIGTTFTLRHPWVEFLRCATGRAEAVCLLLPEVAGALADWVGWLVEQIDRSSGVPCLTATGNFSNVTQVLADAYQLGERSADGRPADWSRSFLADCRRQVPHCEPVPILTVEPDNNCAQGLQELIQAQRALGYQFARPMLLCRIVPQGWIGEVVRFGLPEVRGDLHRIDPPPERDLSFWTNLVFALTAVWEAARIPPLADELWDQLRSGRTLSLRDSGFDAWLEQNLGQFAARSIPPIEQQLPSSLAFGPLRKVEDGLWQGGLVAWQDGHFDVTPLHARRWITSHSQADARESLRRRRLTNVPFVRWLSAWATSIEESLRVAVLQADSSRFRRFLETQLPRSRQNVSIRNSLGRA